MNTRRSVLIGPLLLALIGASGAQAQQLDLLEAYRLAEERDPQLGAARQQRLAQLEQVPLARAQVLPQISASGGANRVWEDTDFDDGVPPQDGAPPNGAPMTPTAGSASYNTANLGIDISQTLFRQEAFIALRQARVVEEQAELNFQLARQQLGLLVAEAYFDVLLAGDALRTFEAELRAVENELARAQRRFDLGVGAITEVNDAQARRAATRASLLQARRQQQLAAETLRRRIQAPLQTVADLQPGFTPQRPQPADPEAWVERAERQSLEVRLAERTLEIAQAGVDAAHAERYPRLDLVASLRRDYQGENPLAGGVGVETDRASIGLQLTLPLYAGGGIGAGIRQSLAEREGGYLQLLDAKRNAALAAESAFIGLQAALEQVEALGEALEAAQLAEESTERGLELGQRTTLDLLNVQRERFQVERDLAAARYQYLLAYLQLHAAVGEPLEAAIETVNTRLGGSG